MSYYPTLENKIKEKNMTTHDLAIVLGISDQAAHTRRHGKTKISLSEAVKLCDFFGVSDVKELFRT